MKCKVKGCGGRLLVTANGVATGSTGDIIPIQYRCCDRCGDRRKTAILEIEPRSRILEEQQLVLLVADILVNRPTLLLARKHNLPRRQVTRIKRRVLQHLESAPPVSPSI